MHIWCAGGRWTCYLEWAQGEVWWWEGSLHKFIELTWETYYYQKILYFSKTPPFLQLKLIFSGIRRLPSHLTNNAGHLCPVWCHQTRRIFKVCSLSHKSILCQSQIMDGKKWPLTNYHLQAFWWVWGILQGLLLVFLFRCASIS